MKRLAVIGLSALLLAAAPAAASTFLARSDAELLREADAVVEGEVLSIASFRSPSGRLILTEAMVRVADVVVGEAPTAVVVRTAGGTVGGYTVEAHGFPEFRPGERLLLYVTHAPDGTSTVTGYRQGQYRIVRDRAGVDVAVPTLERNVRLLDAAGRPAPRPVPVPLSQLKERLRTAAERIGRLAQ